MAKIDGEKLQELHQIFEDGYYNIEGLFDCYPLNDDTFDAEDLVAVKALAPELPYVICDEYDPLGGDCVEGAVVALLSKRGAERIRWAGRIIGKAKELIEASATEPDWKAGVMEFRTYLSNACYDAPRVERAAVIRDTRSHSEKAHTQEGTRMSEMSTKAKDWDESGNWIGELRVDEDGNMKVYLCVTLKPAMGVAPSCKTTDSDPYKIMFNGMIVGVEWIKNEPEGEE